MFHGNRDGCRILGICAVALGAGILILEGLDLTGVPAGRYTLCAFPLNLPGGNGSPVRAVLLKEGEN